MSIVLSNEEYRKSADRYLSEDGFKAVGMLYATKDSTVGCAELVRLYGKPEHQGMGMAHYEYVMRAHNASVEMIIASFDTGFTGETQELLYEMLKQREQANQEFVGWMLEKDVFDHARMTGDPVSSRHKTTALSPGEMVGAAADAAIQSHGLLETSRENRVIRMIENLRNCKMPPWSELGGRGTAT